MATQELEMSQLEVPFADIELSSSTSSWSVAECGWKQILPDLPDEVIAMLATPVVVTASALAAPVPPRRPAADAAIEACTPMFLAPAPARRVARQTRIRFA